MVSEATATISTVCGGCHNMCPMFVEVAGDRVVRSYGVPGDKRTNGALCAKGLAAAQIAHDPRRLLYPMRRVGERGSGRWQRISWDEALAELSGKIGAAVDAHGPWSVSIIRGQACGWGFSYDMMQRLAHCIGIEIGMGASECFVPRAVAEGMTYGGMPSFCDYANTDLMIYWGKQPAFSCAPAIRKVYDARDRGAKLVVIDPLHFHLGAHADQFIRIEPGTDLAMMLAMMHVIIDRGLWDREFVDAYTNDPGLVRLGAHVRGQNKLGIEYTPAWAESICGVPAGVIEALAVEYATTRRASIVTGHGLEGRVNVTQTTRAAAILRAITGHLDRIGCDLFTQKSPPRNPHFTLIDHVLPDFEPAGPVMMFSVPPYNPEESKYPLLFGGQGLLSTPDALRMMHEGKTKVTIVHGANPIVTQPQPPVTTAAFMNVDYIAVFDPYISETAQIADLILPAATYLERTEPEWFKSDSWYPVLTLRQKTVQIGESIPDTAFAIKLGRALGYTDEFPTEEMPWYIDECLKPSGITYQQLLDTPGGVEYAPMVYEKFKTGGFRAPGGKVNIFSEVLDQHGFDPLPNWEEGSETVRSRPDLAEQYPFLIFTGRSGPMYVHEQRRTIPWLRELRPVGKAMINPADASRLGIAEDDWMTITSPRGSMRIPAEVTPVVGEGVVYVPGGWVESNYNDIGIDEDLDPISSQANYMHCLGAIEKA